jgi:cellulose synthase/poly-beta-1,6-N-acetylglucosamine synthase-like glycosyltransferase
MNADSPIVSVIMPCYNQGQYLDEAVESVLAQTYQNFEIIVINDGSTDAETIQMLRHYEKPQVKIIHTENRGPSVARNTGIEHACGQYILPLDADDRIGKAYLESAVAVLEADPNVGIVYSEVEFFGTITGKWALPDFQLPEILLANRIFNSSMYRRVDWEKVGGYRENMVYCWEDYDFWLALIELGRRVVRLPEIFYFYRQVPNSRDHQANREQRIQAHAQIYHNHPRLYSDHIDYIFRQLMDRDDTIEHCGIHARQLETTLKQVQWQLEQTQWQLEQTQEPLGQTQGQLVQVQRQLAQTQAELAQVEEQLGQTQAELVQMQEQLAQTQEQLGQAKSLTAAMQTSKFWKLRSAWFRVKRAIGLSTENP